MALPFFLRALVTVVMIAGARGQCCTQCYDSLKAKFQSFFGRPLVDFSVSGTLQSYNDWQAYLNHCNNQLQCGIFGTSCPIGQYLVPCADLAWTFTSRCQPCPDKTFRSSLDMANCQACRVCSSSEIQNGDCSSVADRQCGCRSGQYRPTDTSCADCSVCRAPTQFLRSACTLARDTECGTCDTGLQSIGNNQLACSSCADGYFKVGGVCTACTVSNAACTTAFTYISCQGGERSCLECNGHEGGPSCAAGREMTTLCTGNSFTNPPCSDCTAGMERPDGTPRDNGRQRCVKCGFAKYKTSPGTSNCGNCTNKPANSVYRAWGSMEAASTASCPWNCNAGYYRSGSSCQPCATGTYQSNVSTATACVACTTKGRLNSYFLQRAGGVASIADNCPWDCNAGFKRDTLGAACEPCAADTYREAARNRMIETQAINNCSACPVCESGITYQTRACTTTLGTLCKSCTMSCGKGKYIASACTPQSNTVCASCVTRCPANSRLSPTAACKGDKNYDEVLVACVACLKLGECQSGYYLTFVCTGNETRSNECRPCTVRSNCLVDQYAGGCQNLTDTQCLPYTNCGFGFYLEDESRTRDGVCKPCGSCGELQTLAPCTRYNNVICRGDSCGQYSPCKRRTSQNRSAYFCYYGAGVGLEYCGLCPSGYDGDGHYCVECPRGMTCNRVGEVECRGQCEAGVSSRCETNWNRGFAVCDTPCSLPAPSTRIPWRGSYVRADETDCATYFLCGVGYYKNFTPGGSVECNACSGEAGDRQWVTDGLSVGDAGSCLWECKRALTVQAVVSGVVTCVPRNGTNQPATNEAGMWSLNGVGGSCGVGRTSEAQRAMTEAECLACPPLEPDVQGWLSRTTQCEWTCQRETDDLRGGSCVPRRYDCNTPGVVQFNANPCVSTSFPWNRAGYRKTGWAAVVRNDTVTVLVGYSPGVTFASRGWGLTGRHTVTLAGFESRTVEGPLCSATNATVLGRQYIFGSVCNRSFLVWMEMDGNTSLKVLIGNTTRGWRDGFRTQALFESELYVAWSGSSLFVLDRWNCLLREVVVWERPGDYRTRVYTLWGITTDLVNLGQPRCVGTGALTWPRRWWQLADGWLLFTDEYGLWQMHGLTKELREVVREEVGGFESDQVELVQVSEDRLALLIRFVGGEVWTVRAAEEACASGYTSLPGGECTVECVWQSSEGVPTRYVNRTTGECRLCSVLSCGLGFEAVLCTAEADGYCRPCASVAGMVYIVAGTCEPTTMRNVAPCEAGFYAVGGAYCEECPLYTSTRFPGANRTEQCKCLDGLARRDGGCVGEGLYGYDAGVCSRVGGCEVPGNARVLEAGYGGEACRWACNAGYYRDRLAGFADQCRRCLSGGVRTSGDDDSPWSCE